MNEKNPKVVQIHKDNLYYGELYETQETANWSEYIEIKNEEGVITKASHGDIVEVPEHSRLMFRSFAPYSRKKYKDEELALFYWMEEKRTVCLIVSKKLCWFTLKHIPWELRHISTRPQVNTA